MRDPGSLYFSTVLLYKINMLGTKSENCHILILDAPTPIECNEGTRRVNSYKVLITRSDGRCMVMDNFSFLAGSGPEQRVA